jgi:nucleoside-diphosphate-sugar epimerase
MNIIITGINGFIGRNLVASFCDCHTIYGLSTGSSKIGGVICTYSWNDLNTIQAIDVVVHLAGKAHDTQNKTEKQEYFDINTGLTKQVFDWFLQSTAQKFIFFSSVKAAADAVDDILTEDAIPSPGGPYGESKLAAEEYVKAAYNNTVSIKQVYILRPCMIHGPGNKGNLNLLYNVVRKGIPWPLGAFENKRSFTSIDNLIYIVKELIEYNIEPGLYNIADDEALSTNEVIQIIGEVMSSGCRVWNINRKLMINVALLGSVFHLPLNRERLNKLTENYVVSNEKVKKVLGIESLPVSAREGLVKTIRSFESGKTKK